MYVNQSIKDRAKEKHKLGGENNKSYNISILQGPSCSTIYLDWAGLLIMSRSNFVTPPCVMSYSETRYTRCHKEENSRSSHGLITELDSW